MGRTASCWRDGKRQRRRRLGKMPRLISNCYLSTCTKHDHCFHEHNNQACGPGALTLREAAGLLLNKKAVLQQDTAPVGSHLVLCNENQRGTSTDSAATPSSRSRSRRKRGASEDVKAVTQATGASVQQDSLRRGRCGKR